MPKQSMSSVDILLNSLSLDTFCGTGAVDFSHTDIVSIVGCDPKTAQRWLAGTQQPGPVALRLLNLHAHGRVVPDTPDWRRWRFYGDVFCWDRSNWQFDGEQARQMFLDLQTLSRTQAQLAQAREYIVYLENLLPRADVVPLPDSRPGSAPVYTANPYFGQRADESTPERLTALRRAAQP